MIFPIGHFVGSDDAGRSHVVRVGDHGRTLSSRDDLRMWLLAHGIPGGPRPLTRSHVLGMAERVDIGYAQERLDRLESAGLVVDLGPAAAEQVGEFAQAYRLVALMSGSDQPADTTDERWLDRAGRPAVTLDDWTHTVWCWAPLSVTLWGLCVELASFAAEDEEVPEELIGGPEEVLGDIIEAVAVLLAENAAHLDPARA